MNLRIKTSIIVQTFLLVISNFCGYFLRNKKQRLETTNEVNEYKIKNFLLDIKWFGEKWDEYCWFRNKIKMNKNCVTEFYKRITDFLIELLVENWSVTDTVGDVRFKFLRVFN